MRPIIALLAVALVIAAFLTFRHKEQPAFVRIAPPAEEPASNELPKLWALPSFSLTDQHGQTVTLADLRGKVWAADFIYTTCPGPCPMLSARMQSIQKKLGDVPDVRLISISTDPEKDTPEVLAAYAKRFNAGPNWSFLTGDKQQITDLSNKGFKLSLVENPNAPDPITHGTKISVVDRNGFVRAYFDGTDSSKLDSIVKTIKRLLEEKP